MEIPITKTPLYNNDNDKIMINNNAKITHRRQLL
jgi:hypothetical protein